MHLYTGLATWLTGLTGLYRALQGLPRGLQGEQGFTWLNTLIYRACHVAYRAYRALQGFIDLAS